MLRALLTPRWLGALLLSALFAVAAYHLGHWQYGKHVAKVERNERISAHFGAAPVPVGSVLTSSPVPIAQEWTHVSATGTYGQAKLVARGRPLDKQVGYEVLAPFRVASGATVLIDRGWIPLGDKGAAEVPAYAAPPPGEVTLTGWVRPGEKARHSSATAGTIASINLPEAAQKFGTPLLGGYVQLEADTPAATAGDALVPQPLGKPDRSLGPHQAYAYQWWTSMPLGFILMFFGLRREAAEGRAEREVGEAPAGAGAGAARTPAPKPPRPKKTRIWDEEDA